METWNQRWVFNPGLATAHPYELKQFVPLNLGLIYY